MHLNIFIVKYREGKCSLFLFTLCQDSWYDKFRGAVNLVQVFDGKLKKGDQVKQALGQFISGQFIAFPCSLLPIKGEGKPLALNKI